MYSFLLKKTGSSCPKDQFMIPGYKQPYRFDMSPSSEGLLVLTNDQLSSNLLREIDIAQDIQILPIELNLNSKKCLLLPIYKPPKHQDDYFREHLSKVVDSSSKTYDNILTTGDFNLEENSPTMRTMMNDHNLTSLIQTPTCFKSEDERCIDLILTNRKSGYFNTKTFETGFSDFHHMVYTNLRTTYIRLPPRITKFRSYRKFSDKKFRAEIAPKLSECQTSTFDDMRQIYLDTLNKLAPPPEKSPFVVIISPICLRRYGKP